MELDLEVAAEKFAHHLRFAPAQQAVVDEDAGQAAINGFVQQGRGDARIAPAAQAEDHFSIAYLLPQSFDGLAEVIVHRPVFSAAADAVDEVGKQFTPSR